MCRTSFTMSVLVTAALIALLPGSVGIYGVLSYVVSQRTAEIGSRSALGASPGAVRRMILSQGMWLAGIGLLIGFAAALILAVLASLLPAARAAGTTPVDAMRA